MAQLAPMVKILPLVVVGILLAEWVVVVWWVVALAAVACGIASLYLRPKWVGQSYGAVAIVLWALCSAQLHRPQCATQMKSVVEESVVVTTHPSANHSRWQRSDATLHLDGHRHKVILSADSAIHISLGQRATASGFIAPLPEGSYGELMARRGYYGTLYLTHPNDYHPTDTLTTLPIAARRVQQRLIERIHSLGLNGDEQGVVVAMLLGSRDGLSPALRRNYSLTGSSHLLAISGLHVGLVAMVVWWLCWALPLAGRKGHLWRNLVAGGVMVAYAFITGLSPSVVRATLMFYTAQIALAYGTPRQSVGVLCGAAVLMLLANPNNLYDISFQLSVVAVVGIAVGYEPLSRWLGGQSSRRWLRWLVGIVVVALCSTAATLPLVAHTFGTVSWVGIFLNPIVILTAQIIVLSGIIWVSLPLEALAPVAKWVIGGAATLQNQVVERAAQLPAVAAQVEVPTSVVVLCYALMALGVVAATLTKERKQWNNTSLK